MAKRKIIKNYQAKKKGEQGSIFEYKGKTKTSYGYILELPPSPSGKRNKVEKGGFKSEMDAVLAKRKLEISSGSNTRNNIEVLSLDYFFNKIFLKYLKNQGLEDGTIKGYISNFKDAKNYFGNINIIDIKKKDFEEYKNYLIELNRLSNSTINEKLKQVKNILTVAVELDYLENNLFTGKMLKTDKKRKEPYSNEDIKNIFNIITNKEIIKDTNKFYIPFMIALHTGARQGEILALKWENVNLKDGYIIIDKSMKLDIDNNVVLGSTKTDNIRKVPINNELKKVLESHKLGQKKNALRLGKEEYIKSDFVCTYENGKIVNMHTLSSVRYVMINHCVDFQFHRFRHTYATRAVKAGIHQKVLQDILGHADIATTMEYYASTDMDQMKEAAELIYETFES